VKRDGEREAEDPRPVQEPAEDAAATDGHPIREGPVQAETDPVAAVAPGPPFFRLAIREELPTWAWWALGVIPILALIGLWWLLTAGATVESRVLSPTILPSPAEVVRSFPSLWFDRALTRNVLVSLSRVVLGFLVGVAIAFPLGLMMGSFTKVKATFNPLAVLGAYLPIPALVPLTLSLLGTGEKQKIGFLALAFVVYLLPLIAAAVDDVDAVYLKTAYTLGANRWQVVRKVLLAVAWRDIYQALRMGFGIGWSYILLAEMVDIGRGIGGLIITSQRRGPREHIYLALLVIVALAFVTDKVWAAVGRRLFPYREER
jgi:ABC-type nitrate/sulfonate/bicarbonate transport system permease component